jgi:hypothetical protein
MTSTFGARSRSDRWRVHTVAAGCRRAVIVALPLPLSAGVGILVGWSVGGDTSLDIVTRVVAAGLSSAATFAVIEWVALGHP